MCHTTWHIRSVSVKEQKSKWSFSLLFEPKTHGTSESIGKLVVVLSLGYSLLFVSKMIAQEYRGGIRQKGLER